MEVNPPKQEHLLALKGKVFANPTPLHLVSPLLSLDLQALASRPWPVGCRPRSPDTRCTPCCSAPGAEAAGSNVHPDVRCESLPLEWRERPAAEGGDDMACQAKRGRSLRGVCCSHRTELGPRSCRSHRPRESPVAAVTAGALRRGFLWGLVCLSSVRKRAVPER